MTRPVLQLSLLALFILVTNNGSAQTASAKTANLNGNNQTHNLSPQTRIVDGKEAQLGQFPWQAAVNLDNKYFCGGSIIQPTWILTAGHCTKGTRVFGVTVGTKFSEGTAASVLEPDRKTVVSVIGITHPLYTSNNFFDVNDIGLILLPETLVFTPFVNAIELPTMDPEFLLLSFKNVTVSGWGKTSDEGGMTSRLRYTDLTVIPGAVCSFIYKDLLIDQKICCGSLEGHSTCNGDSGGPLIYRGRDGRNYEVGVVSYGSTTCTKRIPVVFTRVTSFLDFINVTTGLTKEKSPSTLHFPIKREKTH